MRRCVAGNGGLEVRCDHILTAHTADWWCPQTTHPARRSWLTGVNTFSLCNFPYYRPLRSREALESIRYGSNPSTNQTSDSVLILNFSSCICRSWVIISICTYSTDPTSTGDTRPHPSTNSPTLLQVHPLHTDT